MAQVNHSSLSDPYLHEPKGIAAASNKMIYVADGSGSGDWVYWPTGWGNYKDNASAQTFNTTPAKLSIDGAGSSTEISYLPPQIRGSGALWDTTNDLITPIHIGDAYTLRIDLPVTAKTGSPNSLFLELDIGGGATPSTVIVDRTISVPSAVPYTVSVGFPIFCLTTFKTNGGQIFLSTDTGTVDITAPSILISRMFCGDSF